VSTRAAAAASRYAAGVLPDLQNALAALVTEGALARRYAASAGEALEGLPLDAGARALLAALAPADVGRYAESLAYKRWDEVREALPLTAAIVPDLGARYRAWLLEHPAPAEDRLLAPGPAEALRALPALAAAIGDDPGQAPWAAELLAFETLRACSRSDGETRHLAAGHAVHELAAELERGLVPLDPAPAPHQYRFERARVGHRRRP
jgi:hypothetical protein